MSLDQEAVQRAAAMIFWADVRDVFGEEGVVSLKNMLNSIREFFQAIPPDQMATTFVFICRIQESETEGLEWEGMERFATALSRDSLFGHRRRMEGASSILIEVRSDGRYDLATSAELPSLEAMSYSSIVFMNQDGMDRFYFGGRSKTMPALATGAVSNFAAATVGDLDEALERYRQVAAEVSCPVLQHVWIGGRNGHRLVFMNKPEATMRRSLEWFLNTSIAGDVSVRPEHNTDETKPVDLIVNWFGSKMRALIEIKWLGDSLSGGSDGTQFTSYRDVRAQEGAKQLVDYLDREQSTDPTAALKGYLVVFDGRRRSVVKPAVPLTAEDALYYRDREINMTRDYSEERTEIAPVIRYFMEPRQSLFAPPKSVG